jgi:DNA polymerase III delta prime subunit
MSNFNAFSPTSIDDVIYLSEPTKFRISGYAKGFLNGNIIIFGSNGTGKTTLAHLLPQAISGSNALVENLTITDLLSQKNMSDYIAQNVSLARLMGGKYYIITDEFDKLAKDPVHLWLVLDKYSDYIMLIVTTNEIQNIHKSLRSRCELIEMPALKAVDFYPRANEILNTQGIVLPRSQLMAYLKTREHVGDMRGYLRIVKELIFLAQSNLPLPPWKPSIAAPPILRVVSVP